MTNITNLEVAILQKFNKLAERHGLHPMDFVVTLHEGERHRDVLDIECMPADGARLKTMLASLGIAEGKTSLEAKDHRSIYDALVNALDKAPRPRSR